MDARGSLLACLLAGTTLEDSPVVGGSILIVAFLIVVREGISLVKWLIERRNGHGKPLGERVATLEKAVELLEKKGTRQ